MRLTTFVLAACTVALYYASEINQRTDHSLDLIELETSYGIQFWIPFGVLTILSAIFNRRVSEVRNQISTTSQNDFVSRPKMDPSEPKIPSTNSDTTAEEILSQEFLAEIKNTILPAGAKIKYDFNDRYPLKLKIERCTPEMTRSALKNFAYLIHNKPTPPQILILFVDVIASGIPYNAQVSGAFRKHFTTENLLIRSYEEQVEVRFLLPDKIWQK